MIETLPDSAPVFHFASDPTIDGDTGRRESGGLAWTSPELLR